MIKFETWRKMRKFFFCPFLFFFKLSKLDEGVISGVVYVALRINFFLDEKPHVGFRRKLYVSEKNFSLFFFKKIFLSFFKMEFSTASTKPNPRQTSKPVFMKSYLTKTGDPPRR